MVTFSHKLRPCCPLDDLVLQQLRPIPLNRAKLQYHTQPPHTRVALEDSNHVFQGPYNLFTFKTVSSLDMTQLYTDIEHCAPLQHFIHFLN